MAIVYRHIRPDKNQPFYVGIGKEEERAYNKVKRNKIWKDIKNKNKNYVVEIIFRDLSWEEACRREILYIKLYGRIDQGTGILANMTGGDGTNGLKWSDESRKRVSEQRKGIKQTPENIAKRVAGRIGKPLSEEHKQKLRESKLGDKNPWFGKKFSEDHINKLIISLTGRTCSQDTRLKIARAQGKKVFNTATKEIFLTIKEAADSIGMKRSTLESKLRGENKNNTNFIYLTNNNGQSS